jgi:hypothetical protein
MASVKIDLGFGEQAILSERSGSVIPTAKQQRDAEEFLRRWPRTRSIERESDYLRQLGLSLGPAPHGVNADTSERLRAAVKSGKVAVVIERAARSGGGASAGGPTMRPYPLEMRAKAAWAAPAEESYTANNWLPNYDDVSADDLVAYLEDFLGRTGPASTPDVGLSNSLADAQPFDYAADPPLGDIEQDAAAFLLSPAEKAECLAKWEEDQDMCWSIGKAMGGYGTVQACIDRARFNYNICMGHTQPI